MILLNDMFLNLMTRYHVVRKMSKKSRFREPFDKYHGERAETLFKTEQQHLYHIYWPLWMQLRLKKSLWVKRKIIGLFVNPLTADDKYSHLKIGYLLQLFQMPLSQKGKILSQFSFTFSKFKFNFEHFQKGWLS